MERIRLVITIKVDYSCDHARSLFFKRNNAQGDDDNPKKKMKIASSKGC